MIRFTSLVLLTLAACTSGGGDTETTPATSTDVSTTEAGTTGPTTDILTGEPASSSGLATDIPTGPGPDDTSASTTDDPTAGTTGDTTTGDPGVVIVPGFEQPESVEWSASTNFWFVSNLNGNPGEKDGNGYISRLNPDGSIETLKFIEGLDSPAGLHEAAGVLFVADVDTLRVYDPSGASLVDVPVPGAMFLNDVVLQTGDDTVYVSDTFGNTIYAIPPPPDMPMVLLMDPSLDAPNGLMFMGDQLYIGAIGSISDPNILGELLIIDGNAAAAQGSFEGKIDGLEVDGAEFLLTEFSGQLRRVSPDGETATLIRDFTADGLMSTADLGFDPDTRTVALPDLVGNQVAFWQLP